MKSIHYTIRYENQTVDEDTVDLYDAKMSLEKLACELAQGFLLSEVYDIETDDSDEDEGASKLGECIPCQIGERLWNIQFVVPFCPNEEVTVRFLEEGN